MSKTSEKSQQILEKPYQISIFLGGSLALLGACFAFGFLFLAIIDLDKGSSTVDFNGFWKALTIMALGAGVFRLGLSLSDADERTIEQRVKRILEEKYGLQLRGNPLIWTQQGAALTSGRLPATLEGFDVEVLVRLSKDGTDVIAYMPGTEPLLFPLRPSAN